MDVCLYFSPLVSTTVDILFSFFPSLFFFLFSFPFGGGGCGEWKVPGDQHRGWLVRCRGPGARDRALACGGPATITQLGPFSVSPASPRTFGSSCSPCPCVPHPSPFLPPSLPLFPPPPSSPSPCSPPHHPLPVPLKATIIAACLALHLVSMRKFPPLLLFAFVISKPCNSSFAQGCGKCPFFNIFLWLMFVIL